MDIPLANMYRQYALCQAMFQAKQTKVSTIVELIEGKRSYSLLEGNKYLRRKKNTKGKQVAQVESKMLAEIIILWTILEKDFKNIFEILQKESDMNTLVPSTPKCAFFISSRYFHNCHFLGIFRFLSYSLPNATISVWFSLTLLYLKL